MTTAANEHDEKYTVNRHYGVTIDNLDREQDTARPWTVSCSTCEQGISFHASGIEADDAASVHVVHHLLGSVEL